MEMQDGLGYDWSYIAQDEPTEVALMVYTSNSSGSDTETLSKANLEFIAYQLGLESVEAQLVVHQKNEAVYEEKIAVLEFEVKDKRYGDQLNENDSSGNELFNSVFDSRSSDGDDNQTNDRFKKDNGYHDVPPPLTGNYMPPLADLSFAGLDDSIYRPTSNKTSASMLSGVIIKEWVSDDDEDIFQSNNSQATNKPSFKRIEFTNARNESVKPKQAEKPRIITQNPKVDKRDWNGKMTQKLGLGFGFTKKAFLTRLRRVLVSAAKQSSPRATASTSTFRQVNIATHTNKVNVSKLRTNAFHKSHSPIRRSFYKSTAPNTSISNKKVNTIRVNGVNTAGQTAVSVVKENGVAAVKASAGYVWRPKMTNLNNLKDLPEPFNDTYETPKHSKKVFSNMARQSTKFSGKVTPLFDSMLVQNQAPEGEGSATPPEPQPTPSTSQPNVYEPIAEPLQTETPLPVFHEPQSEAHTEQIFPSPTTYQRKRKTQKRNGYRWQSQAPRYHGGAPAQTRSERVLEKPNEPPLSKVYTSGSGEGSMEYHFELTDNVLRHPMIHLSQEVLDLEKEKNAQAVEILRLKKRVKRLERQRKSSTSQPRRRKYRHVESLDDDLDEEDASKQGRKNDKTNPMLHESDFDGFDDKTVDAATAGVSTASAPVTTAGVAISTAEPRTPPTTTVFDDKDVKAKEKGVAFKDVKDSSRPVRSITTLQPLPSIDPKDKDKGILVEDEPKKVKSRDQGLAQIESDAELAQRLHEEELAEIDADALFAAKLQQEER
ncbi:hypothetical protein Tco_0731754 [Tanacetum coccineum]